MLKYKKGNKMIFIFRYLLFIDLIFFSDKNLISGETNLLAPKEQPPRKLSGKWTDIKHNTLERDLFPPKEQNSQAKIQMGY